MNTQSVWRFVVLTCMAGWLSGCETGSDSDDRYQIRVTNNSSFPVSLAVDGEERKLVAPDDGERTSVSDDEHVVTLKKTDGTLLFEQTINLNDGTYVRYTVAPGGSVTATGGMWNDD